MGQFFTEFGRINVRHPHEWDFLDQPVVNTRFFGPDGMRGPGVRLGWLTGLPWFCDVHFGAQNANGETMTSFFSERGGVRGVSDRRPAVRRPGRPEPRRPRLPPPRRQRVSLNACTTVRLGASTLFGPERDRPDGSTWITGADLIVKWRPQSCRHGWPFVTWQSEVIYRNYRADDFFDAGDPADPTDDVAIPGDTLDDWGLYSQLLYGFQPEWIAGIRYEYATGSGADVDADDRHAGIRARTIRSATIVTGSRRCSPSCRPSSRGSGCNTTSTSRSTWRPGTRTRSGWRIEFLFGKHAAHKY